jgi:hypothetical protein
MAHARKKGRQKQDDSVAVFTVLIALDDAILFKPQRQETALMLGTVTHDYLEKTANSARKLNALLRNFRRIAPNVKVILRPHPGTDRRTIKNVYSVIDEGVLCENDRGIVSAIAASNLFVTRLSSSVSYAKQLGVPTAIFDYANQTEEVQGYKHLETREWEFETAEELFHLAETLKRDSQNTGDDIRRKGEDGSVMKDYKDYFSRSERCNKKPSYAKRSVLLVAVACAFLRERLAQNRNVEHRMF